MSQTLTAVLSIIGAITGTLGAISGYYSHVASGYRVRAEIGYALEVPGGIVKIDHSKWKGGFGLGIEYKPGSEKLFVQVWNRGRMPVDVDRLEIITRPTRFRKKGRLGLPKHDPPSGVGRLPHRLDYGSSDIWLFPLTDAVSLSKVALLVEPKRRGTIQVELSMGDNRTVRSRNSLAPEELDLFMVKWTEYQEANPSEFWRNILA